MRLKYRKLTIFFFVIIAIAALAGGAGVRYVSDKMQMTPAELVLEKPFGGKDVITVLVLGEDETFSKNPDVRGRTDTILVGAIDLKNKRVQGISIPRDTRVRIPGKQYDEKINAAFVHGGPEMTAQTVANLLGIPIDYYIKTNIAGLEKTVDILGGVEIDIEKNMHYVDRRGGLYINLKKGHRHLNGDQALQYVRFRHDRMGDLTRIERQQKFLRAVARRMTVPENWTKLPTAMDEILANVQTSMTSKELLTLARLSRDVQVEEVKMVTLPGVPDTIRGVSYYVADTESIAPLVDEIIRFQQPKPTVAVLNGSGVTGAAERLAELLRGSGYRVTSTGNAKRMDYQQSIVFAEDPTNTQTQAIADLLNCTAQSLAQSGMAASDDAKVVVIIGRDYL